MKEKEFLAFINEKGFSLTARTLREWRTVKFIPPPDSVTDTRMRFRWRKLFVYTEKYFETHLRSKLEENLMFTNRAAMRELEGVSLREDNGYTYAQIGKILGVTKQRAWQYCNEPMRKRPCK